MLGTQWRRATALDLNAPGTTRRAEFVVPLLLGTWSALLGVDANWDLYSYHLYNPFALLHGKLDIDLAPAGLQSYFNPLLDIPYYLLSRHVPAPLLAFVMGVAHGFSFVLLLRIARRVLVGLPAGDENRVPLLLALAGVLTANFLAELGNTMGDNATALFCLGSLAILLSQWESVVQSSRGSSTRIIGAGLVMGLGVGLKLTNATYAVALCVALLSIPAEFRVRLKAVLVCGIGIGLGVVLTAGYWHYAMWAKFGNPLFPQFSALFPNPLSLDVMVSDTRWLPKGALEVVLWPFIFSLDSHRVGEASLHQAIWPIVYVLFVCWLIAGLLQRSAPRADRALDSPRKFIVVFVATAYLLWMMTFSIGRYLIAAELLAPIVAFALLAALIDYGNARRLAAFLLCGSAALVLAGGVEPWAHRNFGLSIKAYDADVPAIEDPSRTTALIVGGYPPWTWLATFFPPDVAFVQLGGYFPEGPAFGARVRELAFERRGLTFALFEGERDRAVERVVQANEYVSRFGITTSQTGCNVLRWAADNSLLRARVQGVQQEGNTPAAQRCVLGLRPGDEVDLDAANAAHQIEAAAVLATYGFVLERSQCSAYRGRTGRDVVVYQWCRVLAKDAPR